MNLHIMTLMLGCLSISSLSAADAVLKPKSSDSNQAKRDISLSYAATDIGSKEGTRVKTITVIKNVVGKKDKPIKVDPKLHKSEDWGSKFRDNFDTYGVIPDVPDIDDLFEFVNKKEDKKPKEKNDPKKDEEEDKKSDKDDEGSKEEDEDPRGEDEAETTAPPAPVEEVPNESSEEKVEKILGDAELIQPGGAQGKVKSQSLDLGKYSVQETQFDVNYSTPNHSVRQYFSNTAKNEKYLQSPPYYYTQPGRLNPSRSNAFPSLSGYSPQPQAGRGSISVTTPSGRKFDVPVRNATDSPPYIAPNFRRVSNTTPGQQIVSSSQRPYIAPNVRKSYDVQLNNTSKNNFLSNNTIFRQQPALNVYRNIQNNLRPVSFGGNKPNLPRSRGLRY